MEIDNPVSSGSAMQIDQTASSSGAVQSGINPGAAPGSAPAPVSSGAGAAAAAASVTVGGTENAADLKFGQDFRDIHILSNAQVAVILQVSAKARELATRSSTKCTARRRSMWSGSTP